MHVQACSSMFNSEWTGKERKNMEKPWQQWTEHYHGAREKKGKLPGGLLHGLSRHYPTDILLSIAACSPQPNGAFNQMVERSGCMEHVCFPAVLWIWDTWHASPELGLSNLHIIYFIFKYIYIYTELYDMSTIWYKWVLSTGINYWY